MFDSLIQILITFFLAAFFAVGGGLLAYAIYRNWGTLVALLLALCVSLLAILWNITVVPAFWLYHRVRRVIWPWIYGERGEVLPKGHIRTNLGTVDTTRPRQYQVSKHQEELKPWAEEVWPEVHSRLGDSVTVYYLPAGTNRAQERFVLKPDLDEFIRSRGATKLNEFKAPFYYLR